MNPTVLKWKRDLEVLRRYGADAQASVLAACIADLEVGIVPDEGAVLTVQQVADLLDVHPQTVYSLVRERKLASVKVGRTIRIPSSAVQLYLGGEPRDVPRLALAR